MIIYISGSWKHRFGIEMLTDKLRSMGHEVLSFIENTVDMGILENLPFEQFIETQEADGLFAYDTQAAATADIVVYYGPSGLDAWAEIGIAWQSGRVVLGLLAKGEQIGLLRKMVHWHKDINSLLETITSHSKNSVLEKHR